MSNGTCKIIKFQLTAARRRLGYPRGFQCHHDCFNSQPPEGGWEVFRFGLAQHVSFNSQPPEGGWILHFGAVDSALPVSTHSRPKAAGHLSWYIRLIRFLFQLTAARRRLDNLLGAGCAVQMFQLTAARRRLASIAR